MHDEGADRIRTGYGGNVEHVEVKRRYDPGNLFHVDQSIAP